MKTIGLLGGMSWESSASYYRILNTEIKARLGGLHSAKCLLMSVDFAEIEAFQKAQDWDSAANTLIDAAQSLEAGGADLILICTNTMHSVYDRIQDSIGIPIIHIADATAKAIQDRKLTSVALLGTKFTMEQDFYTSRLTANGLSVLIPEEDQREQVHKIIYEELCKGAVTAPSRESYRKIIEDLATRGVEGVILGCTEIGLLIRQDDVSIPVFDTTVIHAREGVRLAMAS